MKLKGCCKKNLSEKEIRCFLTGGPPLIPEEERKRKSLELLYLERKSMRLVPKQCYGKRVLNQAAYISPLAWILQGCVVLLLGSFLNPGFGENAGILSLLAVCGPLVGIIGITEILRSYRDNVWELEQACRYNLRQLMGMRLLIFGAVDAMIAILVLLGGIWAGISPEQVLLFFLLPQLVSDCIYLYLMTLFRRRFQGTVLIGAAVAVTLIWMQIVEMIVEIPGILQIISGSKWIYAASLASAGLLGLCAVKFLRGIDGKEDERWNFGWTA